MNDQQVIETTRQIGSLLLQKLQGTISEADQAILNDWLQKRDPADQQFVNDIIESDNIDAVLRYLYQIDEEAALSDVMNKLEIHPLQVVPLVPVNKVSNWQRFYKYAAAAIVTGAVITAAVWVFVNNNRHKEKAVVAKHQDIQPGRDVAILTLADGRKVILDTTQDGTISRQGVTDVTKQHGVVVYQSADNNPGNNMPVSYNTLTTPRGGQYQLVLPDGSKVWLNAASSIKYPTVFAGSERKVEITGEAYFEVATLRLHSGQKMPFRVTVPQRGEVEVLGTHFNVNAYDDEDAVKTTLLEGSVKVTTAIGPASMREQSAILKPGEQAELAGAHSPLTIHHSPLTIDHSPNIEEVMAWKNGLFQFQDASIESIMRQVARWYDVQVEYKGKIEKQFIGKIPRRVPVSNLLQILEATGWVHFTIQGKTIIVAP